MSKVYRSAKGRPVDWNALAGTSVPAEQRELQRARIEEAKPKQRLLGGHVPSEPVDEEAAPVAKKGRKKPDAVPTPEPDAEEAASEE